MAQAMKDPKTGQVVLYDDNGRPLGGSAGQAPFSDRSISDISLEEAMQQNVPQPKQPSVGSTLQGMAKDYALKKAKNYALDKVGSALASQAPAALSTSGLGPTVGAATGVGYGAPTVGSGIIGIPGLETAVPNIASEAGSAAANTAGNSSSYLGSAASALAIAKGGYDAYKGWEQGGKGVRSGLTTAGAGVGSLMFGPGLGTAAGAAFGNVMGYGLQGDGWKNKLALAATSPVLLGAKLMGVDLMHKTTKQVQQEHSQQLSELDPKNEGWQKYLGAMRNQVANKETPFAGKYKTFDEYKNAGLEANDLSGVYGNLKAFGPDWSKFNTAQQAKVTQGLIDAGLYSSKKGEVVISDEEKAKQIKDAISSSEGFDKLAAAQVKPATGTGNSAPRKEKKVQKKEKQVPLLKSLIPDGMMAPNYEKNPTQLFSNPYLK